MGQEGDMTKKRKPKAFRLAIWIVCCAAAALLLGSAAYVGRLYYKANETLHKIAAPPDAAAVKPAGGLADDGHGLDPFLLLLAGLDSRAGSGGTLNTDVLMLISVNPATRSASIVSLPRDLLLKPPGLPDRKANYYYAYFYNKDKQTAIPRTKQFFSDLLKLPIDYMALVDFDALRQVVDAVGGLEIDVDMDMKYVDHADGTRIDLRKGLQKLDGQQALDFVRYRKSNQGTGESSDFERNERQQQVIKQIVGKLGAFQGVSQWGRILDIIGDNVTSDIPEKVLRGWIANFGRVKPDRIESLSLDAVWRSPYVYVDKSELTNALDALRREAGHAEGVRPLGDVVGVIPPRGK